MADGDPRLICLLRAVNVGGRNRVPMGALREELARAGVPHVTTMLASGNLLVPWPGTAEILQPMIETVILEAFDVVTSCMVVHPAKSSICSPNRRAIVVICRPPSSS